MQQPRFLILGEGQDVAGRRHRVGPILTTEDTENTEGVSGVVEPWFMLEGAAVHGARAPAVAGRRAFLG
jgi:hypothetical protein